MRDVDVVVVFFFQAEDGIRDDLVTGVQTCALPIYAPAGHDADVLSAVDGEGGRRRDDAGVRTELPQHLSGGRVEGAEVAVIRPAGEDEPAAGGQDPSQLIESGNW